MKRYDLNYVIECLQRDGASIIGKYDRIMSTVIIKFKCKCGNEHEKPANDLCNTGAFCRKCIKEISINKSRQNQSLLYNKLIYNSDLLNNTIIKYEASLESIDLSGSKYLTRDALISFICNCGSKHKRDFRALVKVGAYCINCTAISARKKNENTCMEKYGVRSASQTEETKAKLVNTNYERYGVNYTFQTEKFKEDSKKTLLEKYGVEHASKSEIVKEKMKNTMIERYGVAYTQQYPEFRKRSEETSMKHYGVSHPFKSKLIRERIMKTCLEKYGATCVFNAPEIVARIKETIQKKYNVNYLLQSPIIREKIKQTLLKRYGIENPMHNAEFCYKSLVNGFKKKEYKLPSGTLIYIQGYEYLALNELFKQGILENEIIIGFDKVPTFMYEFNGKKHKYFPDFFIPSKNKVIEVKSNWTFAMEQQKNLIKQQCVIDAGFEFEFMIYSKKHERIEMNDDNTFIKYVEKELENITDQEDQKFIEDAEEDFIKEYLKNEILDGDDEQEKQEEEQEDEQEEQEKEQEEAINTIITPQ